MPPCRDRSVYLHSFSHTPKTEEQTTTKSGIRKVAGAQMGVSHDLWLHPLIEHATKERQAVSTPFWPSGSQHKDSRPKLREAQKANQENERTANPENSRCGHCGTIHHRIIGASEGIQYGTLKIPLGAKMTNGTSRHTSEAPGLSRGTPEHSQCLPNGAPKRPDSRTDKRHPKTGLHTPKDHQDHGTGFRLRFGVHLGLPSGSRP
ncbi:hypothetical protein CDL15_Pgr018545 [Punica granatum]|uniref:Uncharacterized protein n=1 Tax=Punica granatum TaxID=22663 RepID=A0A218WZK8_PUNGR|nr:hypothetical protein CDL15_Pgr018545 [Punica granatum]